MANLGKMKENGRLFLPFPSMKKEIPKYPLFLTYYSYHINIVYISGLI